MPAEIPVVVCGALGKVGRTVAAAVAAQPDMRVAAEVDLDDNLEQALPGAAVMVDFTAPDAAFGNAQAALAAGVAPIVGTTGMSAGQVDEISRQAQRSEVGGAVIPNFAIGAVLMMRLADAPAPYFRSGGGIQAPPHPKLERPPRPAPAPARRPRPRPDQ